MSLPAWAEPDDEGISTYPLGLVGQFLAKTLHIHEPGTFISSLCGTVCEGHQEFFGMPSAQPGGKARRVKVCPKCRKIADERT